MTNTAAIAITREFPERKLDTTALYITEYVDHMTLDPYACWSWTARYQASTADSGCLVLHLVPGSGAADITLQESDTFYFSRYKVMIISQPDKLTNYVLHVPEVDEDSGSLYTDVWVLGPNAKA
jgi:hypothetical protein